MKIGLFGGSFNPIHKQHINLIKNVIKAEGLDRLIIVPTSISPDKEHIPICLKKKVKMIELAIKEINKVSVSLYEIEKGGISYTCDTAKYFKGMYPSDELFFVMGSDSANTFDTWNNVEDITDAFNLLVVMRKGHELINDNVERFNMKIVDVPAYKGSSTEIRNGNLFLLPKDVRDYVIKNRLYFDEILKNNLTEKRVEHSYNVANVAYQLGKRYSVDKEKSYLAGLFHDITKNQDNRTVMERSFPEKLNSNQKIWHAFTGSFWFWNNIAKDNDICNAIMTHSSYGKVHNEIGKILIIADTIAVDRFKMSQDAKDLASRNLTLEDMYSHALKIKKSWIK